MRNIAPDAQDFNSQSRLLRTLAEELKIPLLQIARATELARLTGDTSQIEHAEALADTALKLLDSYVLSTQTMLGQQTLQLVPVSLSATLYDTAQYLYKLAKLYGCKIELSVQGKCGLVMAHPQALQSALTSLGYSFISATQTQDTSTEIILTAKSTKQGVTAAVYTNSSEVSGQLLQQAKELYGVARQPMAGLTHNSGAGVMVASSLFDAMASHLRVIKNRSTSGFAATLLPSQQLALL